MSGRKILFSLNERYQIEKLIQDGLSGKEISKLLNRSPNGVHSEIRRGGGREKYTALKAQEISDHIRCERYERLSERNKGHAFRSSLIERLENLEMQVEILLEIIERRQK